MATGVGAHLGIFLICHGADQMAAGMTTLYTRRYTPTVSERFLQRCGMSPQMAATVNNGISLGGTLKGGALFRRYTSPAYSPRPAYTYTTSVTAKGAPQVRQIPQGSGVARERVASPSYKLTQAERHVNAWIGQGTKVIKNKAGDSVFLSDDGLKCVRFDLNKPSPHHNPHAHVEMKIDNKWIKSGPIYPIDVPHN